MVPVSFASVPTGVEGFPAAIEGVPVSISADPVGGDPVAVESAKGTRTPRGARAAKPLPTEATLVIEPAGIAAVSDAGAPAQAPKAPKAPRASRTPRTLKAVPGEAAPGAEGSTSVGSAEAAIEPALAVAKKRPARKQAAPSETDAGQSPDESGVSKPKKPRAPRKKKEDTQP